MNEVFQSDVEPTALGTMSGIESLVGLSIVILIIVSMWKVFKKANQPGWAVIVPIYSTYIMLKIANKPGWWLLLLLVPLLNLVIIGIMYSEIAKMFGKGIGFAFLLFFLPFIGFPILAFGNAQYMSTTTNTMTPPSPPPTPSPIDQQPTEQPMATAIDKVETTGTTNLNQIQQLAPTAEEPMTTTPLEINS